VRRRILFAILATVALSLVLAGTGTYILLRRQALQTTESSLRVEAQSLAGLLGAAGTSASPRLNQQRMVTGLRLEGIAVLVRGPAGNLHGDLPEGISAQQLSTEDLVAGTTLSGRAADSTWAAATVEGVGSSTVTVVVTRPTERPAAPIGWFVLAGALALAVGAAVAAWLSDTLTRPLRQATAATARIAGGDLSMPLAQPPPTDHDEVADLTRSINAMAASLNHSRGLERQFILSISHDLRTPLTSIRGYADAIGDGTAAEPAEAARVISTEAQRLSRLVGDLLDLARLDAREFSFQLQRLPVNEVVTETVEGFRPTAEGCGVALQVVDPPGSVPSLIDPDRLAQALANLLDNGLKYATSAVSVTTTIGPGGDVTIAVSDDGPGIAPADVPYVFERLYVTDRRPRRPAGGTGLGLAIVREVVGGMGGRVWAESPALPDGRGARMIIALPAAAPDR